MAHLEYNPFDPEIHADPYPCYRSIRTTDPVHWNELLHMWMIMRHADIQKLLGDPRLSSKRVEAVQGRIPEPARAEVPQLIKTISSWMLFQDPPDHGRLRTLFTQSFTPRYIERLRPRVAEIAGDLIDEALGRKDFDAIRDLGYPLPVIVIGDMLGVPREDRDLLKTWSDGIARVIGSLRPQETEAHEAERCVKELDGYLRAIVRKRRTSPKEDLISLLVQAEEEGTDLAEDEVVASASMLLFAGHETTTNLIGNGLLALVRNPDEMDKLRKTPDLDPTAVEELLRFDSPVQLLTRLALETIEFGGAKIDQGQTVMMVLGSGNRDPEVFSDPESLDVTRKDARVLSFGHGMHYCIGAYLARLEGQIAFRLLLDRASDLCLKHQEIQWRPEMGFRGLHSLSLSYETICAGG